MRVWAIRSEPPIALSPADRHRLERIIADRNARQKHVWRARIALLSADGLGTNTIVRATGKAKKTIWRWQDRFAEAVQSPASRSPSMPAPTTGGGGAAMIATLLVWVSASPWARAAIRYGAIALAVLLFLLALRRSGERAGRMSERLEITEKPHDVQRRMLEATARRPRDRDDLADRLRDGRF